MSRVVTEIRRFAARYDLTGPGVVAVSGGADSVALLRGLHEAGLGPLTVAHLNHQLRGEESDADEQFVTDLAEQLGQSWRTQRVNVAAVADQERANIEAVARRLRYVWFPEVAVDVGASWIATGHTADDQAETVLHRLIRGTGIQGLRGIAPWRAAGVSPPSSADPPGGLTPTARRIVRPLLAISRAEVLACLASLNQPYREDSSNADPLLTRNRIRHELLPLLKTFNPAVVDVLGRLAAQAEETFEWTESHANYWLVECELPRASSTVIVCSMRAKLCTDALLRNVLRLIWQREQWPTDPMTFDHWNHVVRIVSGDAPAADFPGKVHVRRVGKVVQLARRQ